MENRYFLWAGAILVLYIIYWMINRPSTTPVDQEINAIIKGDEHKVKGKFEE